MKLLFTDASFTERGKTYEGIPFLVDKDMALVEVPNDYLFHVAVVKGRTRSPRTWRTYGNHLYEYFAFLEANDIPWDQACRTQLAVWRDSMLERGCKRSTVNQRISAVSNFYCWAKRKGRVASLPFELEEVRVSKRPGFLAHVSAKGNRVQTNELLLRTFKSRPRFLTEQQAETFVSALSSRRNRLIAYLMWFCGLRRQEVCHLNANVLPNPSGLKPGQAVRMTLNADVTPTKGSKTRWVLVPYALAVQLVDYLTFERPRLVKKFRERHGKNDTDLLFLSEAGDPLSLEGMNNAFRKASQLSGIKCTPHMLRHTYGTYEFIRVSGKKDEARARFWLKERMGHNSYSSTEGYVHSADLIDHDDLDAYQAETLRSNDVGD